MESSGKMGGACGYYDFIKVKTQRFAFLRFWTFFVFNWPWKDKRNCLQRAQFAGSVWVFKLKPGGYVPDQQELSFLTCNINSFSKLCSMEHGYLSHENIAHISSMHAYPPNGECCWSWKSCSQNVVSVPPASAAASSEGSWGRLQRNQGSSIYGMWYEAVMVLEMLHTTLYLLIILT